MSTPLCRHCHKANASRPRGLCWKCYFTPNVRGMYSNENLTYRPEKNIWHVVGTLDNGSRLVLSTHSKREAAERSYARLAPHLEGYREIKIEGAE